MVLSEEEEAIIRAYGETHRTGKARSTWFRDRRWRKATKAKPAWGGRPAQPARPGRMVWTPVTEVVERALREYNSRPCGYRVEDLRLIVNATYVLARSRRKTPPLNAPWIRIEVLVRALRRTRICALWRARIATCVQLGLLTDDGQGNVAATGLLSTETRVSPMIAMALAEKKDR